MGIESLLVGHTAGNVYMCRANYLRIQRGGKAYHNQCHDFKLKVSTSLRTKCHSKILFELSFEFNSLP